MPLEPFLALLGSRLHVQGSNFGIRGAFWDQLGASSNQFWPFWNTLLPCCALQSSKSPIQSLIFWLVVLRRVNSCWVHILACGAPEVEFISSFVVIYSGLWCSGGKIKKWILSLYILACGAPEVKSKSGFCRYIFWLVVRWR